MPYSTLFGTGTPPTSPTTFFTVPADYIVVVRDIEFLNFSGADCIASVSGVVPGPLGAIIWYDDAIPSAVSVQWQGRVVLPTGTELQWSSTTASAVMTVSGYLLSSP